MMPKPSTDPSSISPAEHYAFLHRLAVGLVSDRHLAEDLVQETWRNALTASSSTKRLSIGWFVTTLRHLAINRRVSDRRQIEREENAAVPEIVEAEEVTERLEGQTLVLEAVRRLPESLRTAIYLRYFEELGPSDIAAKTSTNLATVKSRLARARELLRDDLNRNSGGADSAWLSVLVPTFSLSPERTLPWSGTSPLIGKLAMSALAKTGIAAALVVVGFFAWTAQDAERDDAAQPLNSIAKGVSEAHIEVESQLDSSALRSPAEGTADERIDGVGFEVAPTSVASESATMSIRGYVLDPNGRALAHVGVALVRDRTIVPSDEASRANSSGDGSFELESIQTSGELVVDSDRYVTVFSALVSPATTRDAIVIGALREQLSGSVVDESGFPLEGAEVSIVLPDGFRRRIPFVMDDCLPVTNRTLTDSMGRFEFQNGARVEGAVLHTALDGYATRRDTLANLGADSQIVLRRPGTGADAVFGIVLDERGLPVSGARVSFGAEVTSTDTSGAFQLLRNSIDRAYIQMRDAFGAESRTLSAVAKGHLPASLEVPLDLETGRPLWPDGVVLQLVGQPLEISGSVVDPTGEPLEGIRVFLEEASLFTMTDGAKSIENLLGGDPNERITMFATDAEGRFRIGGLQNRAYPLVAFVWDSAVQIRTDPIQAGGPPVEIVLDSNNVWSEVWGHVITPDGRALAGVEIRVFTDATNFQFEGRFARTSSFLISTTRSDQDGYFRLKDVPKQHVYLLLMGDQVIVTSVGQDEPLGDRGDSTLEDLEFIVSRRAQLQVTIDNESEADEVALLDNAGQPLELRVHRGKPGPPQMRMPFYGTRTDVLAVNEAAQKLVYYKEGEVVRSRPIALLFGLLNEY